MKEEGFELGLPGGRIGVGGRQDCIPEQVGLRSEARMSMAGAPGMTRLQLLSTDQMKIDQENQLGLESGDHSG